MKVEIRTDKGFEEMGKPKFKIMDFSFINPHQTIGILKNKPKLKNRVCRFDVDFLREFLSKIPEDNCNSQYVGIYIDKIGHPIMHSHKVVLMGLEKYKNDIIGNKREGL